MGQYNKRIDITFMGNAKPKAAKQPGKQEVIRFEPRKNNSNSLEQELITCNKAKHLKRLELNNPSKGEGEVP